MSYAYQGKGMLQVTGRTNGYNISDLDDLFAEIEKPEKMIEQDFDGLVLSCLHYLNETLYYPIRSLQPTMVETNMAEDIRDYYSKKLMLLLLQGKTLTKFRKDLLRYIENGYKNKYPEKFTGLIFRLPEFYEYDKQLDELRLESKNVEQQSFIGVKDLVLVKKISKNISSGKYIDYWFHDYDKHLYKLTIRKENELLSFFDSYLKRGTNTIKVTCRFVNSNIDGLHYCKMRNTKLLD